MDLLHFRLNPRRSNHPKPFPCIPCKTCRFLLFDDQISLFHIFRSTDEDMNSKLPTLIGKAMQEYQKAVKEEKEKQAKKEKKTKKKNR